MPMAARIARSGSSSCGNGVPKIAMIASPMNLSSMPPWREMHSTMMVKYSFSSATVPCAPSSSVSVVKPRMSENRIVASWLLPPSRSSPLASSWSVTAGSMYFAMVDLMRFSELMSSRICRLPALPPSTFSGSVVRFTDTFWPCSVSSASIVTSGLRVSATRFSRSTTHEFCVPKNSIAVRPTTSVARARRMRVPAALQVTMRPSPSSVSTPFDMLSRMLSL